MNHSHDVGSRSASESGVAWLWRSVLFIYLLWLPLPFASVVEWSWIPLTLTPIALLAIVASWSWRTGSRWRISNAAFWWSLGGVALTLFIFLQVLPLPAAIVKTISPESGRIWQMAASVINNVDGALVPGLYTISVDPSDSRRGAIGLLARVALLILATRLFRTTPSRIALAVVLLGASAFQVLYGIGHGSGPLVEIWGRENLTYGRMSGTFVNPNHLANYLALILPLALYMIAHAWNETRDERSIAQRIEKTILRHTASFVTGCAGLMIGTFGVLLTKSRGALLSLLFAGAVGLALLFEENAARRHHAGRKLRRRAVWAAIVILLVLGASAVHLGTERITKRMIPDREGMLTLAGRIEGARIALETWKKFPLTGSGFETLSDVSLMVAPPGPMRHSHAHNDWLELLATTGLLGVAIAIPFFLLGLRAMGRYIWPAMSGVHVSRIQSGDWRRFASMAAISILIAMLHALVDFAFYIPANSYTLATLTGAAFAVPRR